MVALLAHIANMIIMAVYMVVYSNTFYHSMSGGFPRLPPNPRQAWQDCFAHLPGKWATTLRAAICTPWLTALSTFAVRGVHKVYCRYKCNGWLYSQLEILVRLFLIL